MKKNRKKQKKHRSKGSNEEIIRTRLPQEGEILGQVIQLLGGRLLLTRCVDGKIRQIHIPGKHRRRMWTRLGDVILTMPQYGLQPDTKGSLVYRYRKNELNVLRTKNLIPEEFLTVY
ncbi:MAG: translation initiation factor 1A [Methanobacteriota archaeon]|nr:MAG: translation initiation factor 1A [Euryarchaeota archaeon]